MSGSVYSITPTLGVALNMTWGNNSGGPSPPATGPQFPPDILQLGMQPGKVMRGSDANNYLLAMNGSAALTAGATVNVGAGPGFIIGGTGGTAGTVSVNVPGNALCWVNIGM